MLDLDVLPIGEAGTSSRKGDPRNPLAIDGTPGAPCGMRILVVGDLHSDTAAASMAIDHAAAVGADVIVQLGDFGFWPRTEPGRKFLRKTEARLAQVGMELWWLDGNHDDHLALVTRQVGADGRRQVSEHMFHLPRGHRWAWGHTTWMAAGGAVSVDRYGRTEGVSWFRDEVLTDSEVDKIIADGPADVVVSHDAPWGLVALERRLSLDLPPSERESWWPDDLLVMSDEHMQRVRRLVDGVRAVRVLHGHHHSRYDDVLQGEHGSVKVTGLGDNEGAIEHAWILVDETGEPTA